MLTPPQRTMNRWRSRAQAVLIVVCVTSIMTVYHRRFLEAGQGTDFPHFYCAAKILAAGLGHQLYDVSLQWEFQRRYAGRVGNFFIHPPFEAVIYLPFTGLPIQGAYLAWSLFSLVVLGVTAWLLHSRPALPFSAGLTLVLLLAFVPVSLNFLQGQDTILLLLVFVLAGAALERDREFGAGCLLAAGLFKFQFVLPAAVVVLLTRSDAARRARFVGGFALVAVALVILSVGISGWSSLTTYPRLLLGFGKLHYSGFHPEAMATVRGASMAMFPDSPALARAVWIVGGLVVLAIALDGWRRLEGGGARALALSNTVLAAVLLSYQASPHDLTLVLLPLFLSFNYFWKTPGQGAAARWGALFVVAALFLPPLHVYAVRSHQYVWLALPVTALLALNYFEIRRVRGEGLAHYPSECGGGWVHPEKGANLGR